MLTNPHTITDTPTAQAPVETGLKTLQRLRRSCRTALDIYIDAASHSSGSLGRLNPGSIDPLSRTNLALLRQKERRAQETYLDAQARLLEFLLANESVTADAP